MERNDKPHADKDLIVINSKPLEVIVPKQPDVTLVENQAPVALEKASTTGPIVHQRKFSTNDPYAKPLTAVDQTDTGDVVITGTVDPPCKRSGRSGMDATNALISQAAGLQFPHLSPSKVKQANLTTNDAKINQFTMSKSEIKQEDLTMSINDGDAEQQSRPNSTKPSPPHFKKNWLAREHHSGSSVSTNKAEGSRRSLDFLASTASVSTSSNDNKMQGVTPVPPTTVLNVTQPILSSLVGGASHLHDNHDANVGRNINNYNGMANAYRRLQDGFHLAKYMSPSTEKSKADQEYSLDPSDNSLPAFVMQLEDYTTTIPDAVTSYYLEKSGFRTSDPRITRLVSIAAQKFISDIAQDTLYHYRMNRSTKKTNEKLTLTTENLTVALKEQGIKVSKPPYFN